VLGVFASLLFQLFDVRVQLIEMFPLGGELLFQLPQAKVDRKKLRQAGVPRGRTDVGGSLNVPFQFLLFNKLGFTGLFTFGPAVTILPPESASAS
jgi:hypothetical protein